MTWLHSARANRPVQSAGMIRSPAASAAGQQQRAPNRLARNSRGKGSSSPRVAFDQDQIAGVKQAGDRRRAGRRAGWPRTVRRCPTSAAPQPAAASESASACSADGHLRASHRPQAAKKKLEILPNRVALPSLVSRMPACQAARSAAKKNAAKAMAMVSGLRRQMHRLAEHPGDRPQERQRQREPPESGRDRADPAVAHQERPAGQGEMPISRAAKARGSDFAGSRAAPRADGARWKRQAGRSP